MSKLDSTLWGDMLAYLRDRHAPLCRQWFETLKPLTLDGGLLRVKTTNGVQQNYLQKKCVSQFTEAAQAITGNLVGVEFLDPSQITDADREIEDVLADAIGDTTNEATGTPRIDTESLESFISSGASSSTDHAAEQLLLSPDYSFDNFVTGPENQLAYAASIAVANQPGVAYNPLFIHGGVGLGKTHLLQAICQAVLENMPERKICYLSCGTFVDDFVDCVQRNKMADFRSRYRKVDLLVIDDIQFLAKRERTQEEFFHTFNELYQAKKQIVLSSDRPPSEIQQLEERLISRFNWGLVADVNRPTFETRMAIVRAKSTLRGIRIDDDVVTFIAEHIESNARELEGAITSLQANAKLRNCEINLDLAVEVLGGESAVQNSQVTLQQIIDAVTAHYNVKLSDLQSKRRNKSITEPRQICMWLARKRTRYSLQEIGGYFGGRDHTTVMHSIRTVDDRMGQDPAFQQTVTRLDDDILKTEFVA
jgi:chromosomal replication initiator protein